MHLLGRLRKTENYGHARLIAHQRGRLEQQHHERHFASGDCFVHGSPNDHFTHPHHHFHCDSGGGNRRVFFGGAVHYYFNHGRECRAQSNCRQTHRSQTQTQRLPKQGNKLFNQRDQDAQVQRVGKDHNRLHPEHPEAGKERDHQTHFHQRHHQHFVLRAAHFGRVRLHFLVQRVLRQSTRNREHFLHHHHFQFAGDAFASVRVRFDDLHSGKSFPQTNFKNANFARHRRRARQVLLGRREHSKGPNYVPRSQFQLLRP